MTYNSLQKYTYMVVGKRGIQTFKVAVVVLLFFLLSFDVFSHKCTSLTIFGQTGCLNILKCQLQPFRSSPN